MEHFSTPLVRGFIPLFLIIILTTEYLVAQNRDQLIFPNDSLALKLDKNYSIPEELLVSPNIKVPDKYPMNIINPDNNKEYACRYFSIDESKKYTMRIIDPLKAVKKDDNLSLFKRYFNENLIPPDSALKIPDPDKYKWRAPKKRK